jgi:3D (Asp-Asp-Asp) domain-containing protein
MFWTLLRVALAALQATSPGANAASVHRPQAHAARCRGQRVPPREHVITRRRWLRGVAITEYYSTPERLFSGRLVRAPGLPGRHHVDWLYSSQGMAMEGDGIDARGHHAHIAGLGAGGWVNARGHRTIPGRCAGDWSRGRPVWLEGGWRDAHHHVTYPLQGGGWSNGRGVRRLSYRGVTFSRGSSIPLTAYRTLAVDPGLIPRGSRVFIPFYKRNHLGSGWFVAQDTGGAIIGRHLDVYRPPPASLADLGRYLRNQRVLVVPPGA